MSRICILTDSSAQFTHSTYAGHGRVHIIPFEIQTGSGPYDTNEPHLVAPARQEFIQRYTTLGEAYDTIVVLTLSALINNAHSQALAAAQQVNNHLTVEVIDSQTTGLGLGFLVQAAAAAVEGGASLVEVQELVRATLPHIYMLFCIPELTTLANIGNLDMAQALVGEMLGMLPIFVIEAGRLTPMLKVRTQRHMLESFQEFMNEFDSPAHIALVRGTGHNAVRIRPIRQYIQETFPETVFSEHTTSPHMAVLFGPQNTCLTILERTGTGES